MNEKPGSSSLVFRVVSNSAALVGGEFFYRLTNFFANVVVARTLGSESYGKFSFIYVYLSFFEIFIQFGLNSILVRALSQNKEISAKILGNAILLRTALIVVTLPIALFLISLLGYPVSVRQGVFLASFQLFLTLRPIFEAVFRVHLRMIYPVLWNVFRALVNLALVGLAAFYRPGLPWFILAYVTSGVTGFLGFVFFSCRFMEIDFRPDRNLLTYYVKESLPLVVSAYLTLLYYRIDVLMLSRMKDFSAVGYYSTAIKIAETFTIIGSSLLASFFPLLSRSFKEDRLTFRRYVARGFQGLLLLGMPIALGGILVGEDLIRLLFGTEYGPAGVTLTLLCWHVSFGFLGGLLANLLISCGRQKIDMWVSLLLVLANIGLNLLLIPFYSFNGAAVATLLTEMIGVSLYFFFTLRDPEIQISLPRREFGQALKVNLPFFLLLWAFRQFLAPPVLVLIFFGVLSYGIFLFLNRLVSWQDVKNYSSFLRKRSGPNGGTP